MSTEASAQNSSPDTASVTAAVFDQFKVYFDQKLESLSTGLKATSQSQSQKLQRQAEGGNSKFPGNRDQFLFNNDVQDLLTDTADLLARDDEADKLIRQRQKKIKLADKSEAGWLAVKEYEADELASDSEMRSESAMRKRRQTALKEKTRAHSTPYPNNNCVANDQLFFRGSYSPSLLLRGRQVLARRLPSMMCMYA